MIAPTVSPGRHTISFSRSDDMSLFARIQVLVYFTSLDSGFLAKELEYSGASKEQSENMQSMNNFVEALGFSNVSFGNKHVMFVQPCVCDEDKHFRQCKGNLPTTYMKYEG